MLEQRKEMNTWKSPKGAKFAARNERKGVNIKAGGLQGVSGTGHRCPKETSE